MDNPEENLNPKQEEAVKTTEGPVLIVAGAGAGKTKTITRRIFHLIKSGVSPEKILAITFTNKAAEEMRVRVLALLHKNTDNHQSDRAPFIGTFHALGVRIIRENAESLGLNRYFKIFDRDESKKAVRESLKKVGEENLSPGAVLNIISKQKGELRSIEEFENTIDEDGNEAYLSREIFKVWQEYEKILKREGALDFDDLLLKTEKLLRNENIKNQYQNRWQYIHIDEYQDTNKAQYAIAKLLSDKHRNICVVGDHDQCIYSFRGARFKNLIDFEKDYPEAKIILLEENYRSSQNILDAANSVIGKNKFRIEKKLFTKNNSGEKISLTEALDENNEAGKIALTIRKIIENGGNTGEIAVLYRANFQSRALEEVFMEEGLPYQVVGTKFFERKEVKDVVSYLRSAMNEKSFSDIKRIINVPPRGLGKTALEKILAGREEGLNRGMREKIAKFRDLLKTIKAEAANKFPAELINFTLEKSGWKTHLESGGQEEKERLENIFELVNFAGRYGFGSPTEALNKFLDDIALASDQDGLNKSAENIKLMTVHAAKGLEFDYVFISGLEEELFPYKKSDSNEEEKEEERRLFYVALTRARKKVFLSYSVKRGIFGANVYNLPSSFINDIPAALIETGVGTSGASGGLLNIEF